MSTEVAISGTGLKPVSFAVAVKREDQICIIVNLLKKCVLEDTKISIEEIIEAWSEWTFRNGRVIFGYYYDENNQWINSHNMHKERFLKYCRDAAERRAKDWFMRNFYAAVIKGKLLVIPIIEIEEKTNQL